MLTSKPKLYIPRKVFTNIMYWIDKAEGEVGGMGLIQYDEDGNYFYVTDVFLLEQEVTGGTTDLNEIALGKLEASLIKNKVKGDLNFWWHSHVNMGVFWSSTDTDTIKQIGEQGYCVATVFNKKREMKTAVCSRISTDYGQASTQLTDDLTTIIYDEPVDKALIAKWDADFKEKVKERKYVQPTMFLNDNKKAFEPVTSKEKAPRSMMINSKNWGVPEHSKVQSLFTEWKRLTENKPPNEMDQESIIAAAATGVSMTYFNYIDECLTVQQWQELDGYVEKFKEKYPKFDWSIQ